MTAKSCALDIVLAHSPGNLLMKKMKSFVKIAPMTPERPTTDSLPTLDGRNSLCSSLDEDFPTPLDVADISGEPCAQQTPAPVTKRKRTLSLLCDEPAFPSYTPLVKVSLRELASTLGKHIIEERAPQAPRLRFAQNLVLPEESAVETYISSIYFTRRTDKLFPSPLRFIVADKSAVKIPADRARMCAHVGCSNVARFDTKVCTCKASEVLCGKHALDSYIKLVIGRLMCCGSTHRKSMVVRRYQFLEAEAALMAASDESDGPRQMLNNLAAYAAEIDENSGVILPGARVSIDVRVSELRCGLVERLAISIDAAKVDAIKKERNNKRPRSHEHFSAYMDMISESGLPIQLVDEAGKKRLYIPSAPLPPELPIFRALPVIRRPPTRKRTLHFAHVDPADPGDFFTRRLDMAGIAANSD